MTSALNRRLNFIVKYCKNIKKELQNFVIEINFIARNFFPYIVLVKFSYDIVDIERISSVV